MNCLPVPYAPPAPIPLPSHAPQDDYHNGWLGQVPPPAEPETPTTPPQPAYTPAIPQIAPDTSGTPWLDDSPLFPSDPTLFG